MHPHIIMQRCVSSHCWLCPAHDLTALPFHGSDLTDKQVVMPCTACMIMHYHSAALVPGVPDERRADQLNLKEKEQRVELTQLSW